MTTNMRSKANLYINKDLLVAEDVIHSFCRYTKLKKGIKDRHFAFTFKKG